MTSFQTADDVRLGEREKLIFYGLPGSAKTDTAGSSPGPYFILFGPPNELKTLKGPSFKQRRGKRNFIYTAVPMDRGLLGPESPQRFKPEAYDRAKDLMNETFEAEAKGLTPFPIETVILDNSTIALLAIMDKAMKVSYELATSTEKNVLTKYRQHGVIIPGDSDWNIQKNIFWQLVEFLFTLDKHFILIAHEWSQTTIDRASKKETVHAIRPAFTGTHRQDIANIFDNVWRFSVSGQGKGMQFRIQTSRDDTVLAKTRVGGLFPQFISGGLDMTDALKRFAGADTAIPIKEPETEEEEADATNEVDTSTETTSTKAHSKGTRTRFQRSK